MSASKVHEIFGGKNSTVEPFYPVFFIDLGTEVGKKNGVYDVEVPSAKSIAKYKFGVVYSRGIADTFICFDDYTCQKLQTFAQKILSLFKHSDIQIGYRKVLNNHKRVRLSSITNIEKKRYPKRMRSKQFRL